MNNKVLANRYEILEKYKEGGMSHIYLAKDKKFNGTCIVKELKRNAGDQEEIERFLREGGLLYWLKHTCLPRVFDIFIENEKYYLVMDYIEGEDLEFVLAKGEKISQEKVLNWTCQILKILIYLHSKNIIFRDLKPSNIILDIDDKINLVDFGISRRVFPEQEILSDQTRIGTPQYAPDEQYEGRSDPRSDIFALGLVMTELLTGLTPRIRFIPKLSLDDYHPELIKIVEKALDQDPVNRYQSAKEMLNVVRDFIDGKLISVTDIMNVLNKVKSEPIHNSITIDFLKNRNIFDAIERAKKLEQNGLFVETKTEICSVSTKIFGTYFKKYTKERYFQYFIAGLIQEYLGNYYDAQNYFQEACSNKTDDDLTYQGLKRVKDKIDFVSEQRKKKTREVFSKVRKWFGF